MTNAINWFEIPVTNFDKSKKFYETILGVEMHLMEAMGMKSAFFRQNWKQALLVGVLFKAKDMSRQRKVL